jgi:predicted membrane-bound mannosyltransferase
MMRIMREARPRLRTVGAVIAALLVLLVALSPTLLFGQSLSAFDLVLTGASLLGVGLLVRWGGGAGARTLGTGLLIIGAVILALAVGLTALLLAGWGRGY